MKVPIQFSNAPAPSQVFDKSVRPPGMMSKGESKLQKAAENNVIAFLFDATGSRSSTWAQAQDIQADMIHQLTSKGETVEVGVIVHRGSEVETVGWFNEGGQAKAAMQEISCMGGATRIIPGLNACLGENDNKKPAAIVMVGDCFEEDLAEVLRVADKMKQKGIPIHAFHERDDFKGENAYKKIAQASGGVFVKFGSEMDLESLIKPLFVHTVSGKEAFQKLIASGHKGAKALEHAGLLALPKPEGDY